ncbi:MAG: hypothetical protein LBI27_09630 [Clostridiales bacterium]|jgi:hypothetical protein|nr:hypothetical protein [Clostridiales bacterium]
MTQQKINEMEASGNPTDVLELGLLYLKGESVEQNPQKGLKLVDKGVAMFREKGETPSFGHCLEAAMMTGNIKEGADGFRTPERLKQSIWLFETMTANEKGMKFMQETMGDQMVMMVTGLLRNAKKELEAANNLQNTADSFNNFINN